MAGIEVLKRALADRPYMTVFATIMGSTFISTFFGKESFAGSLAEYTIVAALLVALIQTTRTRHHAVIAIVLGVPAIGLRLFSTFTSDSTILSRTVLFSSMLFLAFLIWRLLSNVMNPTKITSERIFAALSAYVFIGLLFAIMYAHIAYREPGAFSLPATYAAISEDAEAEMIPPLTYYSFVTLTTLGYGDVTPVSHEARTLAWFEALVGQLYLAVMVAGLVGIFISERGKDRPGAPPAD